MIESTQQLLEAEAIAPLTHVEAANRDRWIRALRLLPGVLVVAATLAAPVLRRTDGSLRVEAAPFALAGVALMILAAAWGTAWARPAALAALAIVGQACALQLIDAPPYSVYQRYLRPSEIVWTPAGYFALPVLLQTCIVAVLGARHLTGFVAAAGRVLGKVQLWAVLVLIGGASVLGRFSVPQMAWEAVLTLLVGATALLNVVLVVAAAPADALRRVQAWFGTLSVARAIPWALAAWVVALSGFLAWRVLESVPHIPDDASYLFQAKYFASGRLYLPAPPDAEAFHHRHLINDGTKWYAYGFPGWPALLAVGVLAGVPWLVNPVLAGVTVLAVHALVKRLYDATAALAVASLLAFSPWFLFTGSSFMAHTAAGAWALLALLAVDKARDGHRLAWGAAAGACLGMLFLTRPLEALAVGGVAGLWAMGVAGRRLPPRAIVALVVCGASLASLSLVYSRTLTGSALLPPHRKYTDQRWYPGADRLGFGADIGNVNWPHLDPFPGHGAIDVVNNANKNLFMANFELLGWGFGSLLLVALLVVSRRMNRHDAFFVAMVVSVFAFQSLYWCCGGPDFGARYWYQMIVPLLVLTVRGAQELGARLHRVNLPMGAARVGIAVAVVTLVGFTTLTTWRATGKYHRYRGLSADTRRLAEAAGFGRDLVFVEAAADEEYAAAFVENPADLSSDRTIYVRDLGEDSRRRVARAFPGRRIWIVGPEPDAPERVRVIEGPIDHSTVIGG